MGINRQIVRVALLGGGALILSSVSHAASSEAASPEQSSSSFPGWTDFLEGIRGLPDIILRKLPENLRSDPQIRAEVSRLALSAVTAATIDALAGDPDHPVFVPATNNYITSGQPNADTSYRAAKIVPDGTYRLRGIAGSMNQMWLMENTLPTEKPAGTQKSPPPHQAAATSVSRPVHDFKALKLDAEGRYDVILSTAKPQGYTGDWWQLSPSTNSVLVRMVAYEWGKEREPTLSIERLDVPAERPRPSAQALEAKLRGIPAYANLGALVLIDRPAKLREEGYVNKLMGIDLSAVGGLAGQFYYEGAYDLNDDEALILESPVPDKCTYRSLILTNAIYETTDWYNNHSSLNGSQTRTDSDGKMRVVISAKDPGVPNWLDIAGYPSGMIQGRWMQCSSQPIPTVRKVQISQVRAALPADTPTVTAKQREQDVRNRRATLQQRPLW